MDSPETHLCTACGKNPVSHHITSIKGGEKETLNLCDACVEASPPALWKDFTEALKNGRCRFCGGKAAATDMSHIFEGAGVGAEMRFLCRSCSAEYHQRMGDVFAALPAGEEGEPQTGGMKQVRLIAAKVDDHMRHWIRQRDN